MLTPFARRVALTKANRVRWQNALGPAFAASIVLHWALLIGLRSGEQHFALEPGESEAEPVWVELQGAASPAIVSRTREGSDGKHVHEREQLRDSAPAASKLDTPSAGSGRPAAQPAVNLASRPAHVSLRREAPNHPRVDQVQRLRTNNRRATWDERRATPNPMLLSLLNTGNGNRELRRPDGLAPPSRGQQGGRSLQAKPAPAEASHQPDLPTEQQAASPQRISSFSPQRDQRRAAVKRSRPDVQQARPAVPAFRRDRPHDTVDSSHAVAQRIASFIASSTAGGEAGEGYGGHAGPAEGVGQGAQQWGSRSRHSGVNQGDGVGVDPAVSAYLGYVRQSLRRLIAPSFPRTAKAQGRSGMAIVGFVIAAQGDLTQIELKRPSGIADYDGNLLRALHGTRLRPPPDGMAPVSLSMRFDAVNPAVAGGSRDSATPARSAQ